MTSAHLLFPTLWLLLLSLPLCASARAQTACPWLTQGTAETFLNESTVASAHLLPNGEGSCIFTLHHGAATSALQITISSAPQPACPAGKPLTGIGTQAMFCSASPSHIQTVDTVSGRVRDHYFTVLLVINSKSAAAATSRQRESIVERAAEEVAGNLF